MPPIYGGAAAGPEAPRFEQQDRFSDRARALFYARLAFLGIGLGVLAVPSWSEYLGAMSSMPFLIYFAVIGYSVTNYLVLDHPRYGKPFTYVTLCLDLLALCAMVLASGGLQSPIMAGQVMFSIFFALLFPRSLLVWPPLLMIPIAADFSRLAGSSWIDNRELFLVLWYAALNGIAVYVIIYLTRRDNRHLKQLKELSGMREQALITEERLRLAREIHDGLGGEISTLIIQAEYIQRLCKDDNLRGEVTDLKIQAEEAIDELRRSLTMMRRDFDLHKAFEDYCIRFTERSKAECELRVMGRRRRLPSEMQLGVFRILQECLTNAQKHAQATRADVTLKYDGDLISLTVSDDGVGFDMTEEKHGHYGLTNMVERARKFRGTLDIQSAPGAGTTVHVSLVIPTEGSHVAVSPQLRPVTGA